MERDLIAGIHSIEEALKNSARGEKRLYAIKDKYDEFIKTRPHLKDVDVTLLDKHEFQQKAKRLIESKGFEYKRIAGGLLLETEKLIETSLQEFYAAVEAGKITRVIALDQVSDVHNASAIMRSCSFFGIDALVISSKSSFGLTPAFFRGASGAFEHVPLVVASNLSKTLTKLSERNMTILGLDSDAPEEGQAPEGPVCLVLGAEDKGLSNAVKRVITKEVSLKSLGAIKSLNVSVAAALAMEKFCKKA